MRKFVVLLLCFLMVCGAAPAEVVSFGGVSFDRSAETIDMGDQTVGNFKEFIAFLREFPNLKKVDMYATGITADNVEKLENDPSTTEGVLEAGILAAIENTDIREGGEKLSSKMYIFGFLTIALAIERRCF